MPRYGTGELDANFAPANLYTTRLSKSVVIPGNVLLYGFVVSNTNASAQYVFVFDAVAVPGSGAIPAFWINVAGSGDREVGYLPGREFNTGIVLVNSTTNASLTAGAADCLFDVQYETLA